MKDPKPALLLYIMGLSETEKEEVLPKSFTDKITGELAVYMEDDNGMGYMMLDTKKLDGKILCWKTFKQERVHTRDEIIVSIILILHGLGHVERPIK